MHIAINAWFLDNPSVGSGQYLKYLLPALLDDSESLTISLVSNRNIDHLTASSMRLKPVLVSTPFANPSSNLAKLWFEQISFPHACHQLQADVAHVPYFGSPFFTTIPTVVTVHDLIPLVLPAYRGGVRVRLYTALVAQAASRASLIMADSKASQTDILARLRVDTEQIKTVYLAPAPHFRLVEAEMVSQVKAKYNLPDRFILYVGGYDLRKNVSTLVQAYVGVSEMLGNDYPLVLAGRLPKQDSSFFPDPISVAKQLGIEGHIVTPGWIAEEDLPALYSAAHLFVYPSYYEGFGLPVLEAMACGTPVITSTSTSLPELSGSAACLVEAHHADQLTAAMLQILQNEQLVQYMIQQGLTQVQRFSWTETARQTVAVYRTSLER
ncbi:glycosyltransferase family 1 protein [Anaerolineales bacterium HSG24]|nr:glycosyltransferase family 1 protein [Anaerolineales bacterium HSG24]